jgi:hypothetical protein
MRIATQQLKDFLLDSGLLSKEKVDEAIAQAVEKKQELGSYLLEQGLLQPAELTESIRVYSRYSFCGSLEGDNTF